MKRILDRLFVIAPYITIQLLFYLLIINWFYEILFFVLIFFSIISLAFIFRLIYDEKEEGSYKLIWIFILFFIPIFGSWLYFSSANKKTSKPIMKKIEKGKKDVKFKILPNKNVEEELKKEDKLIYDIFSYVTKHTNTNINYVEYSKYYSLGDEMYLDMIKELEKAEKFIFLEYFILSKGKFLNSIMKILEKKVKENVDVRILYDDFGSMTTYSFKNIFILNKKGIKCNVFNPVTFITASLNNRDHRKMMIIDNKVAFSGGINIADEYINEKVRFGHWKDIGFQIRGKAVENYTYMFMEFWNAYSKNKLTDIIFKDINITSKKDGYILSYYDSPNYKEEITNNLYIKLLNNSKKYAWFYTPYLMVNEKLKKALKSAVKRGVDVKIYIPKIPDKKIAYKMTLSYAIELAKEGIEILTYTPGFLHAKAVLIDDILACIGTVNLDYRSLFLTFESNSIFYKNEIIKDLKKDFLTTYKKCAKLSKKVIRKNERITNKIINKILRFLSPLF